MSARILQIVLVAAALMSSLILTAPAHAVDTYRKYQLRRDIYRLDDDISSITHQLEQVNKDLDDANAKADSAKKDAEAANAKVAELKKNSDAAYKEAHAAIDAFETLVKKLTSAFEKSDPMKAAVGAADGARVAREVAREKALVPLRATPEYKDAMDAKTSAIDRRDKLIQSGADKAELSLAMSEVMQCDTAVTNLEQKTLTADADFMAAVAKLDEANAAVTALRQKFKEELENNPDRADAEKTKITAQAKLRECLAQTDLINGKRRAADAALIEAQKTVARLTDTAGRYQRSLDDSRQLRVAKQKELDSLP